MVYRRLKTVYVPSLRKGPVRNMAHDIGHKITGDPGSGGSNQCAGQAWWEIFESKRL